MEKYSNICMHKCFAIINYKNKKESSVFITEPFQNNLQIHCKIYRVRLHILNELKSSLRYLMKLSGRFVLIYSNLLVLHLKSGSDMISSFINKMLNNK